MVLQVPRLAVNGALSFGCPQKKLNMAEKTWNPKQYCQALPTAAPTAQPYRKREKGFMPKGPEAPGVRPQIISLPSATRL